MSPSAPSLTDRLEAAGVDGYLVDADGEDSNQYYLSGYHAPDDFVTLYADGRVSLLVSPLEYSRARTESDGDDVYDTTAYGDDEETDDDPRVASKQVTAAFVAAAGVDSVLVPASFPVSTADVLREAGVGVAWDDAYALEDIRAVKSDAEVEHVAAAQDANEAAMALVEDLLARAVVEDDVLVLDGDVLTSERVRERVEIALLERGCRLDDCIVAAGPAAARGHDSGSGPLEANEPIVVDIFPRDIETRYFADMTRTFVKGEPDARTREWYELTVEAFEAALDAIAPGVSGEAVHDAVCDVYEDAGYPTLRSDDGTQDGFTHATGHGVGLDVHEAPYLAPEGGELAAGNVVTVEPGLYEQGVGGVRLEDLVVVTDDGYENLTEYPRDLRVL
ncbi:M24 family metallopeptidase [Halorubellus sp. JP-L1]|uniref:M24 family metallopeptidase n=1 Tax=Halorubellus sp. JP-L1 TaxID=2715753 RepID=UPI0034E96FA2